MMPLCCTRMETVASPIDSISCGFGPSSTRKEEERRAGAHGATSEAVALVSQAGYRALDVCTAASPPAHTCNRKAYLHHLSTLKDSSTQGNCEGTLVTPIVAPPRVSTMRSPCEHLRAYVCKRGTALCCDVVAAGHR
ncbi:hypothetical protein V8C26DRAFT_76430 [Trichoderma gracile]